MVGNMPDIETVWKREDGGQINEKHYIQGNVLVITNAQREDAGVYICQGVDTARGNVLFTYNAVLVIAGDTKPIITHT